MVLRFEVNQAEAFRHGVNVPKSTNHIDVDPGSLSQEDRDLIANRLDGIDVMRLEVISGQIRQSPRNYIGDNTHGRIVAKLPTLEALLEAIRQNQTMLDQEVKREIEAAGFRLPPS